MSQTAITIELERSAAQRLQWLADMLEVPLAQAGGRLLARALDEKFATPTQKAPAPAAAKKTPAVAPPAPVKTEPKADKAKRSTVDINDPDSIIAERMRLVMSAVIGTDRETPLRAKEIVESVGDLDRLTLSNVYDAMTRLIYLGLVRRGERKYLPRSDGKRSHQKTWFISEEGVAWFEWYTAPSGPNRDSASPLLPMGAERNGVAR